MWVWETINTHEHRVITLTILQILFLIFCLFKIIQWIQKFASFWNQEASHPNNVKTTKKNK